MKEQERIQKKDAIERNESYSAGRLPASWKLSVGPSLWGTINTQRQL